MLISRVYFWAASHTLFSLVRLTKYTDGLYVLLRAHKKKKNQGDPVSVPSHLADLVMPTPAETCPWQLSGPQFPKPTAIQQRYCYPRGPAEYSNRKGGSLWTMYGTDGKEDKEFRLLHVYFSHKRAINKGVIIPEAELASVAAANSMIRSPSRSPARGANRKKRRVTHQLTSPPRRQSLHHHQQLKQQLQQHHSHHHPKQSITTSPTSSSNSSPSLCSSPLSFDTLMPTSPARGLTTATGTSLFPPDLFRRHFHPVPDAALLTPSPFRRGKLLSSYNNSSGSGSFHSIQHSPVARARAVEEDESKGSVDPFLSSDMDASLQEIDTYWDDPLLKSTMLEPSLDVHTEAPSFFRNNSTKPTVLRSLAHSLNGVHGTIRESIFSADHTEQPALVSLVAAWARRVAKDPLKSPTAPPAFHWQPAMRRIQKDQHNGSVDDKDHDHDDDTIDTRNGHKSTKGPADTSAVQAADKPTDPITQTAAV
jgi:hypothetical protein